MIPVVRIAGFVIAAVVLIACGWMDRQAEAADSGSQALGKAAALAAACSGCHIKDGGAIVGLDTRSADEIHASLTAFKTDAERSPGATSASTSRSSSRCSSR